MSDSEVKTIVFSGGSDAKTSAYFKKRMEHKKITYTAKGARRLTNDGYKKPERTITDMIQTQEAIAEKLRGYEEIDNKDMDLLRKGVKISYITFDPEKSMELYRSGGILKKVAPDYIVLAGKGGKTFSVQRRIYADRSQSDLLYTTRFFGKVNEKNESKSSSSFRVQLEEEDEKPITSGKQSEILNAKSREIEELKAKLESLKKKGIQKESDIIKSIQTHSNSNSHSNSKSYISISDSEDSYSSRSKSSHSTKSKK